VILNNLRFPRQKPYKPVIPENLPRMTKEGFCRDLMIEFEDRATYAKGEE